MRISVVVAAAVVVGGGFWFAREADGRNPAPAPASSTFDDGTRLIAVDGQVANPSLAQLSMFSPVPQGTTRWDQYLDGNPGALGVSERRGLALFLSAGCSDCHDGRGIGGSKFRKLGESVPFSTLSDSGRFTVTRDSADLFVYRVATLRNVQMNAPYFHDKSVATLSQAVRLMARHQLAVDLTESQVADIRAYLLALTSRRASR